MMTLSESANKFAQHGRGFPDCWQQVALEKIAHIFAGSSAPQGKDSFSESGAPFVRVSDLGNCNASGVLEQTRDRLSEQAVAGCTLVKAPKGAVLFPKSGAAIATNRRAVLGMDAYIVGHLFALVADPESVTMEWLYFAMRQIDMMEHSDNVGYPSLKKSAVEKITISLPPLAEQKRIVGVLNRKMAAVTMARTAALARVEAAQSLPAAWLREVFAFGGEGLPRGWCWATLNNVCTEDRCAIDGKFDDVRTLPYLSLENIESASGKIIFHASGNSDIQGVSNCFRFGPEHVLYGKLRPYLNKVALPDFSGRCTTEAIPILPKPEINREFLAWTLRRRETVDWAMAEKTGSRMPRTNMKHLMRLKFPLPPLAEQKRLVASLNAKMAATEKVRAAAEAQLEAVAALPAALLREAFSGAL